MPFSWTSVFTQMNNIVQPHSRCRFIVHIADLSALISINLTKWRWVLRRGEGGEGWMGGPLGSPASCSPGSQLGGTRSHPQRRATIKAHPSTPHRPRPYGSPGLLPDFPATESARGEPCHALEYSSCAASVCHPCV